MANRVLDVTPPGVVVLLTGDGADTPMVAHAHGWDVEVISWDAGCNRYLRHFAQKHGAYRPLEPVYDKVTFINNKRWAQRV